MKQKRNRKGSGQIEQRGPDSFRLRFTVNGKRISVAFTGTKAQARAKLRELTHAPDVGKHVDPSKEKVGDFVAGRITQWEQAGEITGRTAQRYRELLQHQIAPHIGAIEVQRLTSLDVEAWHNTLRVNGRADGKGGLAPRTIGHAHRILSQALSNAAKHKLVTSNVIAGDAAPGPDEDEEDLQKEKQIVTNIPEFLETLRKSNKLFVPAVIAIFTGMRLGEILALRWSRINFDKGVIKVLEAIEETRAGIRIKPPKSKASKRDISMPDMLLDILKGFRREQQELRFKLGGGKLDDALLFVAIGSNALPSQKRCSKAWSDFADQVGMPQITFHSLRHSHASWLINRGVDIVTISKRLGHSSPDITLRIYSHMFKKDDSEAAVAINKALK